ncbi:MAG: hypothetical protein WD317_00235 [Balneolaceae bacterium]
MIPHLLILEPELKVFKIYNGYWYAGRPSIHEMIQDVREVNKKIRFDWDLTRGQAVLYLNAKGISPPSYRKW